MTLTNQTSGGTRLHSRFTAALSACVMLLLTATGCGDRNEPAGDASHGPITVVATTTVLEDVARQIAGGDAQVLGIMRVGEDPHVYEVRPQDAVTLSKADVVLANGFHLEATLGGVIDQVAANTHVDLAQAAGIDGDDRIGSDVYAGAPDPHIWMDPKLFARVAHQIGVAMAKADPDHAAGYTQRAAQYTSQLNDLHADITQAFATIPQDRRTLITSHDAFNYYARAYALEIHGVVGISTDAQPTGQQVESLRALVRDRGVRALFIETSTSPTLNNIVKKVADEAGIAIGGTLYSDSLGAPDTPGGTYLGMMRHNTQVIITALTAAQEHTSDKP